jgi:hypothetical protein
MRRYLVQAAAGTIAITGDIRVDSFRDSIARRTIVTQ